MNDYKKGKKEPIPPIIQKESQEPDRNVRIIKEIVERKGSNRNPTTEET